VSRDPAARPRLVELVGPAGAGKSTLAAALPAAEPGLSTGPSVWGLPRLDLFRAALSLVPVASAAVLSGHPFRFAEFVQMSRLVALRRVLSRATRGGETVIVLDEGPVFALAWLEVFYAANGARCRNDWRRRARADWAGRLAGVVRLDAEDPALARRIRTRAKPHMVKDLPDTGISDFTARFRVAYDRVIADMATAGLPVRTLPSTDGAVVDDTVRLRDAIRVTIRAN
jgi:energy-coupling factor transporter ATP-binding protein EcfA2